MRATRDRSRKHHDGHEDSDDNEIEEWDDGDITSESDVDEEPSFSTYPLSNDHSRSVYTSNEDHPKHRKVNEGESIHTRRPQTEATAEGEFNVPRNFLPAGSTRDGGALSLTELLDSGRSKAKVKLKRFLGDFGESVNVPAPLHQSARQRLQRQAAYVQSKELADEWRFIVKRNREKESLDFTRLVPSKEPVSISNAGRRGLPESEMEREILGALGGSKGARKIDEALGRLEESELKDISVVEDTLKRAQMARNRALLGTRELKLKRLKRIKSKAYRKILKKQREKTSGTSAIATTDEIDNVEQERAKSEAEYHRARERITQKHKNSSRWARRILKRGLDKADEKTKAALASQLRIGEDLRRKMVHGGASSCSSSDDDSDPQDNDTQGRATKGTFDEAKAELLIDFNSNSLSNGAANESVGLMNLPFMKKAREREAANIDKQARKLYLRLEGREDRDDEDSSGEDEEEINDKNDIARVADRRNNVMASKVAKKNGSMNVEIPSAVGNVPLVQHPPTDKVSFENSEGMRRNTSHFGEAKRAHTLEPGHTKLYSSHKLPTSVNPSPNVSNMTECSTEGKGQVVMLLEASPDKGMNSDNEEENNIHLLWESYKNQGAAQETGRAFSNSLASSAIVRAAFTGDNVVEDFARDKKKLIAEEHKVETPTATPGWGTWGGHGKKNRARLSQQQLQENLQARRRARESKRSRSDARLSHVIITEVKDKKASMAALKSVPFPFTSREQYEQAQRQPLGREFHTAASFQDGIRPSVIVHANKMIKPISKGSMREGPKRITKK